MNMIVSNISLVCTTLLLFSCQHNRSDSALKVNNGIHVSSKENASVVALFNKFGTHFCTGTIIGRNAVMTAAHCMDDRAEPPFILENEKDYEPIRSLSIKNFKKENDFSILIFKDTVFSNITKISGALPKAGSKAKIVGFGCDEIFDYHQRFLFPMKKVGFGKISEVKIYNDFASISIRNDYHPEDQIGNKSNSCSGDSGGALLLGKTLVGVTHGSAKTYSGEFNGKHSFWSAVSTIGTCNFLQKAVDQGADIELNCEHHEDKEEYDVKEFTNGRPERKSFRASVVKSLLKNIGKLDREVAERNRLLQDKREKRMLKYFIEKVTSERLEEFHGNICEFIINHEKIPYESIGYFAETQFVSRPEMIFDRVEVSADLRFRLRISSECSSRFPPLAKLISISRFDKFNDELMEYGHSDSFKNQMGKNKLVIRPKVIVPADVTANEISKGKKRLKISLDLILANAYFSLSVP